MRCVHSSSRRASPRAFVHSTAPSLMKRRPRLRQNAIHPYKEIASVQRSTADFPVSKQDQKGHTPVSSEGNHVDQEHIDWKRQWYAVLPLRDVSSKRPTAITILGKQLVVWRDTSGNCHVFEDRCPHRLVALSEGRIEGDELMCAYHGWKFDGSGACTHIPQLFSQSEQAKAKILQSQPACARAFPTEAVNGLLWVWMSDSKDAFTEALQVPVPDTPEPGSPWYSRTLPMAWEILVENVTDPSHVPHSHHGIQGNRNALTPLEFVKTEPLGKRGYQVSSSWNDRKSFSGGTMKARTFMDISGLPSCGSLRVQMPSNSEAPMEEWEGRDLIALHFFYVPVTRETSRLIFSVKSAFLDKNTLKGKLLSALNPTWKDHITRSTVLDGDAIFLHRQTIDILNGKADPANYFLPARSDRPVHALWAFMRKHAPNGVDFYEGGSNEGSTQHAYWPRERILDRYESHVKDCKACSGALRNIETAIPVAAITGAAALANAARLLALSQSLVSVQGAASMLIAALAGFAWAKLRELRVQFGFADYVHAEKD